MIVGEKRERGCEMSRRVMAHTVKRYNDVDVEGYQLNQALD